MPLRRHAIRRAIFKLEQHRDRSRREIIGSMKLSCLLFLVLIIISCGYGSNYNGMNPGPRDLPNISQLSPGSVNAGGPGFVLTVDGTNFGMGASVYWNSVSHSTTYLTGQQITTTISASDIVVVICCQAVTSLHIE